MNNDPEVFSFIMGVAAAIFGAVLLHSAYRVEPEDPTETALQSAYEEGVVVGACVANRMNLKTDTSKCFGERK